MGLTPPDTAQPAPAAPPPKRRSILRWVIGLLAVLLLFYLVFAYLVMPRLWKRYARRHPALEDIPTVTHTKAGIPGDPLNLALVGSKAEVIQIMLAAKWYPADPITLRSSLKIAAASVFRRSYDEAPVSNLYLFDRKQDLAFQQAVANNPRQRHHVRFWRCEQVDVEGRPAWVGAAIFDRRVGLSRRTGQITHLTDADIDAERDYLFADLQKTGDLAETVAVDDFQPNRKGKNGGGDPWHTDGRLLVGVIAPKKPQ
jgi:hypothetical protein